MQYVSVLTPPLLMCAVVVIAIVAFLRHEMRRAHPDHADHATDIPPTEEFEDSDLDSGAAGRGSSSTTEGS